MSKKLLIDGSRENQTQIALLIDEHLEDYEFESTSKKNLKGNIYLGKVSRIEASLQAAFIDIGLEKNGFLAFGEIHPNYFQIPVADRDALIKEEAEQEEQLNADEENTNINETSVDNDLNSEYELESIESTKEEIKSSNFSKNKKKSNLKRKLYRSYKIQEVIKTGQLILVQVVKEERGNKGAAMTSYISLAGKYTVLMPNSTKTKGISRKIATFDDRNKLKKIIEDLNVPTEMGLIIRTAGLNKTKNEIKKDYTTLTKLWVEIVNETKKAIAPALIHEEGNLLRRLVRDLYTKEMKDVLVQGKDAYQETKKYMSQVLPSCSKFVKQYKNKEPIFSKYKVDKEIVKMFEPEVKLKSGGYIVINPTEALVAIDVNSGGATKERNIEKTALKTNLEAAEEIAKQLKIRDLSGLIVIDFIDMLNFYNRKLVEKKMRESIKKDRARIQIGRISNFGLLEMSRQRLREGSVKWETNLAIESFALKVIKKVEMLAFTNKVKNISLKIPEKVQLYIETTLKKEVTYFEKKFGFKIEVSADPELIIPEYSISLFNKTKKVISKIENINKIDNLESNNRVNKSDKTLKKTEKKQKVSVATNKKGNLKKNKKPRTLWVRRKKKKAA